MKRIPAMARGFTKLEEKGLQHAVGVVIGGILEIKIIVGNQRRPGIAHGVDILNDGGACRPYELPIHKNRRGAAYHRTLFPVPATKSGEELTTI
jgi:hypothetical protein